MSFSRSEFERVRGDLEAMREAAGLGLPFGWEDVWLSLAAVPCGAVLAVLGFVAPIAALRLAIVVLSALVVAMTVGLRLRYRKSTGRSPIRRREYTLALAVGLLLPGLGAYHLFAGKARGVSVLEIGSVAMSFTAAILLVLALTSPGRRSGLGMAAVLLALGLVLPSCSPRQLFIAAPAALAVGGLLTGLIMAWQLRSSERGANEPAAH
jgi:hypothetical protein